jgi:hypothetical protein
MRVPALGNAEAEALMGAVAVTEYIVGAKLVHQCIKVGDAKAR